MNKSLIANAILFSHVGGGGGGGDTIKSIPVSRTGQVNGQDNVDDNGGASFI